MMREKRAQIDTIIQAIEETEKVVQDDCATWQAVVRVMEVMQMQGKNDWQNKYFTPEQRQKMAELSGMSYSEEARRTLAECGEWTEEDQRRVDAQYAFLGAELKRLVAAGADPASAEAQAVAKLRRDLIAGFTQGDPGIEAGLRNWWRNFYALPQEQRPLDMTPYTYGDEETAFLERALEIYDRRRGAGA
jgi:hypothetical protein